jgi:hypothetical protein
VTLADTVAQALEQHGARQARRLARLIITEVRDHDARLLEQIRVRDLPLADCPDGCVVGAEWKRQAVAARHEVEQLRSEVLHATKEAHRG